MTKHGWRCESHLQQLYYDELSPFPSPSLHHLLSPSRPSSSSSAMSSTAGRKKSLIAIPAPSIDLPVATNTALNKAASQSTSLYQQCSSLRTRLMRVQDFSDFFNMSYSHEPSSSRRSTDIVHQLWDCFALGVPLCYLYNLLPNVQPVDIDVANFDPSNDRTRKRAIALFAMNVKGLDLGIETFTVTDLWNRESNDGFVKVRAYLPLPPSLILKVRRSLTLSPLSSIGYRRMFSSMFHRPHHRRGLPRIPPTHYPENS